MKNNFMNIVDIIFWSAPFIIILLTSITLHVVDTRIKALLLAIAFLFILVQLICLFIKIWDLNKR